MSTTNYPIFITSAGPAFVRSACPIKVVAGNANISAGTAAVFLIYFLFPSQAGDTITIQYGDVFLVFTCVSGSPTTPLTYQAGATVGASALNFLNCVASNNDLDRDFQMQVFLANAVAFTARVPAAVYTPTFIGSDPEERAAGSISFAGVDPERAANLSVGLTLYVEEDFGSGNFVRVAEENATPDADGQCEFDVAELLAPYVDSLERIPYLAGQPITTVPLTSTRKRFKFRTWERYGTPPADGRMSLAPDNGYLAVYAGVQRVDHARFPDWFYFVTHAPYRFLTFRGREAQRTASPTEQHWLSWYQHYPRIALNPGVEAINIEARLSYTDGSFSAWSVRGSDTTTPTGQYMAWPAGWGQLGLASLLDPDLQVMGWTVRIRGAVSMLVLSEEYYFTLVRANYNEQHILWMNSLGAWETLRTTGAWQRSTTANYVERSRHLSADEVFDAIEPGTGSIPTYAQPVLAVNSGNVSEAEHRAHLDIIHSPELWLFDHERLKLVPLRLLEASELPVQQRGTANESLFSLALTLTEDDPTPVRTTLIGELPGIPPVQPETPPLEGGG